MSLFQNPLGFLAGLLMLFAFARALAWGLNRMLLWMDYRDWILIPNEEATRGVDRALARMAIEVQAIYEPAKLYLLETEAARQDQTDADESGGAPPTS
ncbi:hypothetical protein [Bryobacter aggregatus]|uniref:hypothetical protein n=1 Tax=Bryobacter aggregatus TaxID=360054 RepID=UPI0004E22914|nr:hypothetical protein [Bryobacter aggregatus]